MLDLPASTVTGPLPATFAEAGVPEALVRSLAERGITEPFPIQAVTLPDSLAGRDVIGRGRTGSGKTVAFSLPTVAVLAADRTPRQAKRPRALVLVPTRELAAQVAETLTPLAQAMQLKVAVIHGGVGAAPQMKALVTADIVVACPGRLEDLIQQGGVSLDRIMVTVLDEADHMADLGFLPSVKRLMDRTPVGGQRLLFSATLDNGVDVLVKRYLHTPVTHSVDSAESPVPDMEHHVLHVPADAKATIVRLMASGRERSLLFTRTKHGAKKLAQQLSRSGIPAVDLHGNLSQNARTRNLELFTNGDVKVLVATDIAARGIHVDDITLVVHVDPPAEHKAFLHRSGRTARAGAEGTVVTIVTPDQRREVADLTRKAGISPKVTAVTPEHPLITELTGPAAPLREMPPMPVAPQTPAGRPGGRSGGGGRRGQSAGARSGGAARPGGASSGGRPQGASSRGGSSGGGRSGSSAGRTSQGRSR